MKGNGAHVILTKGFESLQENYGLVLGLEQSRIWKGRHHSDPCTLTIIDHLCNHLAHSFSSPAH